MCFRDSKYSLYSSREDWIESHQTKWITVLNTVKETPKAKCFELVNHKKIWIPKSCIYTEYLTTVEYYDVLDLQMLD